MNEYGKRVAKKMEDYMGDPNSVSKEINDIQNAIEGVEVRGALAAGVAKSFNKSKNAEEKAEEAHEITQDLLDETFDSAALEANFEQRLDEAIENLQPEWTEFKNDVTAQLAQTRQELKDLTAEFDLVVTVGADGDFTTINQALEYLSNKRSRYKNDGLKIELRLLSGFVMNEQVHIRGIDLGYITITAEDEEVEINSNAINNPFIVTDATGEYPVWAVADGGVMPIIDVLFVMTEASGVSRHGLMVADGGRAIVRPGKGVKNAQGTGIYVFNSGSASCFGADFSFAKSQGARVFRGSYLNIREGNLSNAGTNGMYMGSSSIVEAMRVDLSNAGGRALWAYGNGKVNVREGDLSNAGEEAIFAHFGAIVSAAYSNLSGAGKRGLVATTKAIVDINWGIVHDCAEEGIYAEYGGVINGNRISVERCGGVAGVYSNLGGNIYVPQSTIKNNNLRAVYANRGSFIALDHSDCSENGHSGRDIDVARGSTIAANDTIGRSGSLPINQVGAHGILYREENYDG